MSAKFMLTGAYSATIERKLNEAADMMAATLDQPSDHRAWDQLLIYAPRDALERRLQTLGCEGDRHVSPLRPIRPDDEVRERTSQDRGLESRTENAMAHEPCRDGDAGAQVLSGCVEAVAGIKPGPSDPAQEPEAVAFVPVHPKQGPLWTETYPADRDVSQSRSQSYERMALYTRPVSPGREAVAQMIEDHVVVVTYNDGSFDLNETLTATDAILALIEGRT